MALVCNLHVASGGNQFMADLAHLYAAALGDLGLEAAVRVDGVPRGGDGVVDVVVAPQEYFVVGPPLSDAERRTVAERAVLLTTEQPGSPWWEVQRPWVELAPLVLDLSAVGVAALRASGVGAVAAPLGYHPVLDAWEGAGDRRDLDVCFLGGNTPRRAQALGRLAPVLAHRRSRLLLHDPRVPVVRGSRWFATGRARAELLARSRVLVNVHRSEAPYFEWARALDALCNGALLLTEPSEGHEPLEAFTHFVAAPPELLAAHVTALLADEGLRAKVAGAAYDFVRSELRMADLLAGEVVPALEGVASSSAAAAPALAAVSPAGADGGPAGGVGSTAGAVEGTAGAAAARGGPPPAIEVPTDPDHRTQAALKRVLLGQLRLWRRLDLADVERTGVDPASHGWRATPGWERARPEVSVVVPLYDYEGTVVGAIESALASRDVAVEVIVVEDRSTDGSRAVVERFLDEHPDAPVAAAFRAANHGLSAARNLGLRLARADLCFLLDADNLVEPACLARLRDELEATGAAFAYCILSVFEGPPDLVSALPWSPRTLALGPYIDAMALIRRQAWEEVGGFREDDEVLYGLEDYAFWLAMAARGLEGAWVPEPLARYRRHGGSMTGITGLDVVTPLNHLRRLFPDLPW